LRVDSSSSTIGYRRIGGAIVTIIAELIAEIAELYDRAADMQASITEGERDDLLDRALLLDAEVVKLGYAVAEGG